MHMNRTRFTALAGLGLVALVVAWYLFRPELLFIDQQVSEAFPAPATTAAASAGASSGSQPASAAKPITMGRFKDYAHGTAGAATIYEVDGRYVLRLTEFKTSNGPDVRVVLVAATDATDDAIVRRAGYIDLGSMKGNIGDQNYDIPAGTDLAKYRAVSIWCERFSVNFGAAPLTPSI